MNSGYMDILSFMVRGLGALYQPTTCILRMEGLQAGKTNVYFPDISLYLTPNPLYLIAIGEHGLDKHLCTAINLDN